MSAIEDLINNVVDQDFSKAGPMFTDIIQSKMNDALEQEKINVAAEIYNDGNAVEIEEPATDDTEAEQDLEMSDDEVDDVTDEEIEAAIDELDDELDDEYTEYEFDKEES